MACHCSLVGRRLRRRLVLLLFPPPGCATAAGNEAATRSIGSSDPAHAAGFQHTKRGHAERTADTAKPGTRKSTVLHHAKPNGGVPSAFEQGGSPRTRIGVSRASDRSRCSDDEEQ